MRLNVAHTISEHFLALSHHLYQNRQALYISAIKNAPAAALIVNPQSDREHVEALLDALEMNGGYRGVTILNINCAELRDHAPAADFATGLAVTSRTIPSEGTALEEIRSFAGDVFILSMHPFEESRTAVRHLLLQLLGASRPPNGRAYIYYRDLTLVSAARGAYLRKRIVEIALGAVSGILRWSLPRALDPMIRIPQSDPGFICRHEGSLKVFSHPRRIRFCPTCGMALTPAADIHPALDAMYDKSYALYGRFTGRKEYGKFQAQQTGRIQGYLADLPIEQWLRPGDRVLDFGCGNGIYCKLHEGLGVDYYGYDSSGAATAIAASLNDDAPRARFTSDRREIDAGGGFNAILLNHVLEHVVDTGGLLDEVASLSRSGAVLLIEVPNARTYTWSMTHHGFANEQHVWDFTAAQICLILRERGWRILKSVEHAEPTLPFLFIAAQMGEKAETLPSPPPVARA